MKFITWNVNGLRACMDKGFVKFILEENPDFICLQETKMQLGQTEVNLPGYYQFWNSAVKKGYSGTAIFTKIKPIAVSFDLENQFTDFEGLDLEICGAETLRKSSERTEESHNNEGRLITLEYGKFYLVTEYTPNAKDKLTRINYRLEWEEARRNYLKKLDLNKPVILCGDLNVAHNEIDLKNPKTNKGNAGFSDQERAAFSELIEEGFVDSYRHLYPDVEGKYTWWSYRFNARANNAGWRIDYFVVSDRAKNNIKEVTQRDDIFGSDHCPVILDYIENENEDMIQCKYGGKGMKDYNGEFQNIESVETLENGLLTVHMKNGRNAIVEIIKLNEKFQAAVYSLFTPEFSKSRETLLKKLEKYDGYKECAKDALGWIDDSEFEEVAREEIKFGGK